jgi:2-keto-3-deoxy-L-rhamnonate aldolase RhmA
MSHFASAGGRLMDSPNQAMIRFKQQLAGGEQLIGAMLTIPHAVSAKTMSRAGLDYVMIDLEHLPMSPEVLTSVLDQFGDSETVPIVRVADTDATRVKQVMDMGARGIIFPSVLSAAQAREVVSYCYYPPRGVRGFGPYWAADWGQTRGDYVATVSDATFVAVMIEHILAVEKIDEIATVEGVDALMIGPSDLAGSMGLLRPQVSGEGEISEVARQIDEIIAAGRRHGKPVFHGTAPDPEAVCRQFERGVQAVSIGSDYALIAHAARCVIESVRADG